MRPKGVLSSSGTQNMQSSTGQYSTQAGEPAHPVQHSVMTASSFGFFLRGVVRPLDFGSHFISSGTIPTALGAPGAAGMAGLYPGFADLRRLRDQFCGISVRPEMTLCPWIVTAHTISTQVILL